MKFVFCKLAILLLFLVMPNVIWGEIPRFSKYPVANSGAYVYMPSKPEFELSYSEDSSKVYYGEVEFSDFLYGAIVVTFNAKLDNDTAGWNEMLMNYMDYLAGEFKLVEKVDPGYGHTMASNPKAQGILMYGKDEDNTEYAIKGWIDNGMLAVMYIVYNGELNNSIESLFLNGFRFADK